MLLYSINPATDTPLRSFEALTQEALQQRIELSRLAAGSLAMLPLEHRIRSLRKLAQLFAEEQDEIARTIAAETGKPLQYAAAEVERCSAASLQYAEQGARMLAPEMLPPRVEEHARKQRSHIAWSALGVLLAVVPAESPLWDACRVVLPALMAGNVVLLKHAMGVPQCGVMLEALIRRAGFQRGAVSELLMEDHLVEAAMHDKRVDAVAVIGHENVARALAAQAGWLLKKATVQVLGNGATVVMSSADLDGAMEAAIEALASGVEGGKRLIVHESIYNAFTARLVKCIEVMTAGDPLKTDTKVGPLRTQQALDLLVEHVDAAVKAGGRVLAGGTRLVGRGRFFEPTLLADVPPDSTAAQVVLNGPVIMLFKASGLAEALSLAASPELTGESSVWTRDPSEQLLLLTGVAGEGVTLNGVPSPNAGASVNALRGFVVPKTVTLR